MTDPQVLKFSEYYPKLDNDIFPSKKFSLRGVLQ